MSYDLLNYKEDRIEALLNRVKELESKTEKLTTYIFELCDKECPLDYKRIVQSDVLSEG